MTMLTSTLSAKDIITLIDDLRHKVPTFESTSSSTRSAVLFFDALNDHQPSV